MRSTTGQLDYGGEDERGEGAQRPAPWDEL
jgi:hypothetical protein